LIQLGTIRQRHVAGERDRADRAEAAVEQLRARVDLAIQERDQARQEMATFIGDWERLRADLERVAAGAKAAQTGPTRCKGRIRSGWGGKPAQALVASDLGWLTRRLKLNPFIPSPAIRLLTAAFRRPTCPTCPARLAHVCPGPVGTDGTVVAWDHRRPSAAGRAGGWVG